MTGHLTGGHKKAQKALKVGVTLGHSQNHLAVAGGYSAARLSLSSAALAPTRYREVVLSVSK